MPIYTHECNACTNQFTVFCKMDERNEPAECEFCGHTDSKLVISGCNFILTGDSWPGKNNRIQGQMKKRREQLKKKSDEQAREAPVATLVPNVDGERTESWSDAQKLARDKGKESSTYDAVVRKEQKAKTA